MNSGQDLCDPCQSRPMGKEFTRNPFVFLVGCPRSGTTLLMRLINTHPLLAVPPETHWIPRFFKEHTGLTAEGTVTPETISRLVEHHTFPGLGLSTEEVQGLLEGARDVSYAQFVSGVFDLYGRAQGKELVGDKTPGYVRSITLLHLLWPEAKFIHLIRDGRDVCLSATSWQRKLAKLRNRYPTWSEDAVSTAALWWEWHVRAGREQGAGLARELYKEIRYEALVARPAEVCADVCVFLGVPYHDAMLRFHEGRVRDKPGLDAKHSWKPITPGLRDWRTQMPDADVERFEAASGDLLTECEYPRAFPRARAQALEHASRLRQLFPRQLNTLASSAPDRTLE